MQNNFVLKFKRKLKQSCFLSNFSRLLLIQIERLKDDDLIVAHWGKLFQEIVHYQLKKKNFGRIKEFYKVYHSNLGNY